MGVEKVQDITSDLEVHSRSLVLVPFDKRNTISY